MPSLLRILLSLLCALALTAPAGASSASIVAVSSQSMHRPIQVTVVLPDSYAVDQRRYPVLYFLHGYSGDHTTWPRVAPVGRFADAYRIICVCPDGDYASWYLDSPVRGDSRFDTFVSRELPGFIDSVFRTHAAASGRALIGSSMGGHGALTILARHPDRYAAAASISGIMDLREFAGEWGIADVLGPCAENRDRWAGYSFVGLAPRLAGAGRRIEIDCGKSDFALPGNRAATALLKKLAIPHVYRERPGSHTPAYVRSVAEEHVASLAGILDAPR